MARCLLEKKSVVLVDEATANIDSVTEEMIKNVYYIILYKIFEKYFIDSAMIMIAHKVTTIMGCDKIVVL